MTMIDSFRKSASAELPPSGMGPSLQALWWLLRGDWTRAHECVQQHEGEPDCDRVHAHLHRQEGYLANAGYWYRRAGTTAPTSSLEEEWELLATEMLARR